MLFSLQMAWTYFSRIWSRGILGIMMIISIIGVSLGVASLVITLSVMNGFHSEITRKLLLFNPHIVIMNPFKDADFEARVKKNIKNIDGITSFSKFYYGKGLLHNRGSSHGIILKGIENQVSIKPDLIKGDWGSLNEKSIILGAETARILNLELNEDIFLMIPEMKNIGVPMMPRVEKLKMKGVFSSGIYEYDATLAYVNIELTEKVFRNQTNASGYELLLSDPFGSSVLASKIRKQLKGFYYTVQTWEDRNHNLFAALKLEKTMMFIILVMIIVVATFNIAGTLIVVSITRSKDCGVMRAIGATKKQIATMFRFKGLMIGASGTILGIFVGIFASLILRKYQFIELPPKVYLISTLPVKIDIIDIAMIAAASILISFLSTIYPALRAGKLGVAHELRNE